MRATLAIDGRQQLGHRRGGAVGEQVAEMKHVRGKMKK